MLNLDALKARNRRLLKKVKRKFATEDEYRCARMLGAAELVEKMDNLQIDDKEDDDMLEVETHVADDMVDKMYDWRYDLPDAE